MRRRFGVKQGTTWKNLGAFCFVKKNATSFELDGNVDKESNSYSRSLYF